MIAELHESLVPGVEEAVRRRFAPTHGIEIVDQALRHPASYRALEGPAA